MDANEHISNERWEAHRREHDIHEDAHRREHEQTKERVDTASKTMDLRLAGMNEFRDQINAERATYVTHRELAAYRDAERRFRVTVLLTVGTTMLIAVTAVVIALLA